MRYRKEKEQEEREGRGGRELIRDTTNVLSFGPQDGEELGDFGANLQGQIAISGICMFVS